LILLEFKRSKRSTLIAVLSVILSMVAVVGASVFCFIVCKRRCFNYIEVNHLPRPMIEKNVPSSLPF
jgi:hypothetical protein